MNIPTHQFIGILAGIIAAMLVSPPTFANDTLRQFAMYARPAPSGQHCELVERRSKESETARVIKGQMDQRGCNISIPIKEYEQTFKFCFLSGINVHQIQNNSAFECFVQKRDDDYIFLARISQDTGPDGQIMCYFSCLEK